MKEDWLDKRLGERFDDYDSPVDFEKSWEALQSKREEPKKKRRFFFFWFSTSILILGVVASYFIYSNNTAASNEKLVLTNPIADNQEIKNSIENQSNTNLNNNEIVNHVIQGLTTEKDNESNNLIAFQKIGSEVKNRDQFEAKEKSYLKSNQSRMSSLAKDIRLQKTEFNFSQKENSVFIQKLTEHSLRNKIPKVAYLPTLPFSFLKWNESKDLTLISNFIIQDEIKKEEVFVSPLYNYLTISAGYGIRTSGKIFPDEKPMDVISTNILFEKRFTDRKFYLKTGILFDQFINSLKDYNEVNYSEQRDNQLLVIDQFQNGMIQETYGMGEVTIIEKTKIEEFNRYRLISIPIIFGYDIFSNQKINLQIEVGGARSVLGNHSGRLIESLDNDFEKNNVWQGLYGLNFNYRIKKNIHLFSSVKGNYHFNTIGNSNGLNLEKLRFNQLQVGLRFRL